jgi:hypothetical protein
MNICSVRLNKSLKRKPKPCVCFCFYVSFCNTRRSAEGIAFCLFLQKIYWASFPNLHRPSLLCGSAKCQHNRNTKFLISFRSRSTTQKQPLNPALVIAAEMKRVKALAYKAIGVAVAFWSFCAEAKGLGILRP